METIKNVVLRKVRNTTKQIKVRFADGTSATIESYADGYQLATDKQKIKTAFAIAEKYKNWLLNN